MIPKPRWAVAPSVAVAAVVVVCAARLATLGSSHFGWYHGFNEAVYVGIADAYAWGQLTPMRNGVPFFDTGPLATWLIAVSRWLFGETEAAARVASLAALPVAAWAAYRLAPERGAARVLLFVSCPAVLLWFGRAQTDAWMTAGVMVYLAGLAGIQSRQGWWLAAVGIAVAVLAKQPGGLALVALAFTDAPKRAVAATGAGLVVAGSWWAGSALVHWDAMSRSLSFHATERAAPFGNLSLVVVALVVGGVGLGVAWLAARRPPLMAEGRPVLAVAVAYAAFALWQAPMGHEYYALPASALLVAAPWRMGLRPAAVGAAVAVVVSVPVLLWAGDVGDTRMGETAAMLPPDERVAAWGQVRPQLEHYSGRSIERLPEEPESFPGYVVHWVDVPCPVAAAFTEGPGLEWRVYDCRGAA